MATTFLLHPSSFFAITCVDVGSSLEVEMQTFVWTVELLDGASYNSDGDGSRTTTTSIFFCCASMRVGREASLGESFSMGEKDKA